MEPQLDINDLGICFSKLAEAICVEHNLPIKRKYTHAELEDSFRAIRESAAQIKAEQIMSERPTEEDREEDDVGRLSAYPERRPG